jgi:protein-tyrosine phosphatase
VKVLFVDAGNYCRSPVAEVVARALAARGQGGAPWEFSSAGLKDKHVGDPADPRSIEVCHQHGYDLTAFRCRQIGPDDFLRHDVILAMDRDNVAQLETLRPAGSTAPIRLFLGTDEVPDPYYGGVDGFVTMMQLIEAGARSLLTQRR